MYNLSLPKLRANYYGLSTTVQLRAAHEPMFTVRCLVGDWPQLLYCTWLIVYSLDWTVHFGTVQFSEVGAPTPKIIFFCKFFDEGNIKMDSLWSHLEVSGSFQ